MVSGASDLLDAVKEGLDLDAMEVEELPESLRAWVPEERRQVVMDKPEQRATIQTQIDRLSRGRDRWIASESERLREEGREDGFAATVFEAVKRQAARKGITLRVIRHRAVPRGEAARCSTPPRWRGGARERSDPRACSCPPRPPARSRCRAAAAA